MLPTLPRATTLLRVAGLLLLLFLSPCFAHAQSFGAGYAYGSRVVSAGVNQGVIQLVDYSGTIVDWEFQTAGSNVWQSLGSSEEEITFNDLSTTTQYRASVLVFANTVSYSGACTIQVKGADMNWTETRGFNGQGNLTGASRIYFNSAGKSLQSQSKSFTSTNGDGVVLATQPLFDEYDQAVGSTLVAPIGESTFKYKPLLLTQAANPTQAYDYRNFGNTATTNSPQAVDATTPNTVGYYYSTNNTLEPNTPATAYPYARSYAAPDGSTGVVRSSAPGEMLRLGSGHESVGGSFSVRDELANYLQLRSKYFPEAVIGATPASLAAMATQQVSLDPNVADKAVMQGMSVQDREGHTLMTARPGDWLTVRNSVDIGWPYRLDKPVEAGSSNPIFQATDPIMVHDASGSWLYTGFADQFHWPNGVAAAYTIFSVSPFSLTTTSGAATRSFTAQLKETVAFYNFYVQTAGSVTITPLMSAVDYTIIDSKTDLDVTATYTNNIAAFPAGLYQIKVKKGTLRLGYTNAYQDISYNFYDQRGLLLGSLAPNGSRELLQNGLVAATTSDLPFYTSYAYDQQGRLVAQHDADAGRTEYIYRIDGNLRFSQNAKQRVAGTFSYIGYDPIGRPVETGECASGYSFFSSIRTSSYVEDISYGGSGLPGYYTRREIVRTTYDDINAPTDGPVPPTHNLSGYTPTFTAGRVATVVKYPSGLPYGGYQQPVSQSWYSYDEQGRLKWLIQRAAGKPARTLEYTYDFQGNVLTVCFQRNTPSERLTHYYTYDPNNRLSKVETGQDEPTIQLLPHIEQARYEYYLHGPLKRVVLGKDLQGVDYTYTAQGWLKSINDGDLRYDPGKDGVVNALLPDLFGATLQYYTNDYRSRTGGGMELEMGATNRFDGIVSGQSWQTPQTAWGGYRYKYDSQGQLQSSEYGGFANFTARRYGFMPNSSYQESNLNYDSNGNLKSLRRTDGVGWASMDITYDYAGLNNYTNRLTAVKNAGQQNVISYTYDELGQMTGQQEQDPAKTKYLEYDVSGKVTAVFRDEAKAHPLARYTYDEFGHRLVQQIYPNDHQEQTTHYVRDLAGNEIATYYTTWDYTSDEQTTGLYEQPIYGATRLGTYRRALEQEPEQQLYELNDQLGNARIVFRRPTTATYLLTMEDGRVQQEKQDFPDPAGTPIYDQTRSSNYAHPSPDGNNYSVKLSPFNPIGPAKRLTVGKGDIINLSVWAYYPGGVVMGPAPEMLLPMAVIGATTVTAKPIPQPDGRSQTKSNQLLSRLSLGIALPFARPPYTEPESGPNAALQCVFKQPDGTFISNGTARVTSYSGGSWAQLQLSVTADQAGTIDISLNSYDPLSFEPGKDVYFDDLKIDHKVGPIVEENHFYTYGQRNEGLSWTRQALRSYERGYQGQYSKFDKETGYNSFELRMYDARVGRWMSTDPYGQYHSPYVGMGNNPVNSVDPDGGKDWFRNKSGALEYDANVHNQADVNSRHGGGEYAGKTAEGFLANGSYAYGLADGTAWIYTTPVNIVGEKYSSAKAMMNFSNDGAHAVAFMFEAMVPFEGGLALAAKGAFAWRAARGGQVFYRAMSNAEYAALQSSGGLTHMAGKELFVSSSAKYSRAYLEKAGYDVLVRFKMKPGAMNYFNEIGVMHRTAAGTRGWAGRGSLLWKLEQGVMNLGIQSNTRAFNPWIQSFKTIK